MLAKVAVALAIADVFAADVAHLVPADTGEFVAAGRFDEGGTATRAGTFDGKRHGELDLGTESEEGGLVTDVDVSPSFGAGHAGRTFALRILAHEFEPMTTAPHSCYGRVQLLGSKIAEGLAVRAD